MWPFCLRRLGTSHDHMTLPCRLDTCTCVYCWHVCTVDCDSAAGHFATSHKWSKFFFRTNEEVQYVPVHSSRSQWAPVFTKLWLHSVNPEFEDNVGKVNTEPSEPHDTIIHDIRFCSTDCFIVFHLSCEICYKLYFYRSPADYVHTGSCLMCKMWNKEQNYTLIIHA